MSQDPHEPERGPAPQGPPPAGGPWGGPPGSWTPYAGPGQPPWTPQPTVPTSQKAVWSLGLGLSSICVLGPLGGIPAVVLGVGARRDVAQSQGTLGGAGMALGGIISGVFGTLLWLLFVALVVGLFALGSRAETVYEQACEEHWSEGTSGVDCRVS